MRAFFDPSAEDQTFRPEDTGPEETRPRDTGQQDTRPEETGPEDTGLQDTRPEDTGPEETSSVVDSGQFCSCLCLRFWLVILCPEVLVSEALLEMLPL